MPSAIPKKGESLLDRFKELSNEWHPNKNSPLTPNDVKPGSTKSVWWICKSGHEWIAKVRDRSAGRDCPICSNRQVLAGYNDLASTNQALSKQADGWDPTRTTEKSGKIVNWKCELGHSWKAQIASRSYGAGCPICSGNIVLAGFNDLATTNPDLAAEADGWDPTTVSSGSNKSVDWHGTCGHNWRAIVVNRISGSGCPICAGKSVLVGFNDLATTKPEIAAQADGWDPTTVTANSHKKVSWKCGLGHSWKAPVANRSNGTGCPICSGNIVLAGFNDLATTNPDLAAEADGWDPRTVSKSSSRKQKWICNKGHKWTADPAHRSAGRGCPSCAISGFDPNQDSYLYFIDHFDLHMFQIGITNHPTKRLDKHGRSGWEVIELRGPMDGHLTQQLETLCLQALEKRGALLGHKAGIDKFDGYSEAWSKTSLNVTSIKQILDWVYEDDAISESPK
jgi:tRNA(Arg) A34 adenosine deaminase TadA